MPFLKKSFLKFELESVRKIFLKMGLFSVHFRTGNLSCQQESNSDCRSRRQEHRPLDHVRLWHQFQSLADFKEKWRLIW